MNAEPETAKPQSDSQVCLRCGAMLESHHCKLQCPRCGYTEDCADAGLIDYDRPKIRHPQQPKDRDKQS